MIRRMHFACWITKATDTHSEYVILIAFPRQKWLRERASMVRYAYIACLPIILKACFFLFFPFSFNVIFVWKYNDRILSKYMDGIFCTVVFLILAYTRVYVATNSLRLHRTENVNTISVFTIIYKFYNFYCKIKKQLNSVITS
jgi:hypothetical protein